ncbi:MAG: DC1 domain-containing protein [Promethearchaeota archaeon]
MPSLIGVISALTVIIWFTLGLIWGTYSLVKARKTKSYVLFSMGLAVLFISFLYSGLLLDSLLVLITESNLDTNIHGILTFFWFGPLIIIGTYIFNELIAMNFKKWLKYLILIYFSIISIIYEILLFLTHSSSIIYKNPSEPGQDLIDNILVFWTPPFYMLAISLFPGIIVFSLSFLYGGIKSSGILRKKLILLLITFLVFFGFGSLDIAIFPLDFFNLPIGTSIIIIRVFMIIAGFLFFFSLKEESVKSMEKPSIKIFKSGESKPSLIDILSETKSKELSPEEILAFREQTICLICEKEIQGFIKVFICPQCEALYCEKCTQKMIEMSNMCWICDKQIDESKPIKQDNELP